MILSLALPMLLKCAGLASAANVRDYVSSHYDEDDDTFSASLVRRATIQVKRAAKKKGEKLTESQAQALGIATLKKAMEVEGDTLAVICREIPADE